MTKEGGCYGRKKFEETGTLEPGQLEKLTALFPETPQEELAAGIEEFAEAYPDADLAALCADAQFVLFARGKTLDLATVYGDYLTFCEALEQKLAEKYRGRANRATGSGRARTSASRRGALRRAECVPGRVEPRASGIRHDRKGICRGFKGLTA